MMDKFTLEIELGNTAMNSSEDIAQALTDLAVKFRSDLREDEESGVIIDANGNTVGRWEVI